MRIRTMRDAQYADQRCLMSVYILPSPNQATVAIICVKCGPVLGQGTLVRTTVQARSTTMQDRTSRIKGSSEDHKSVQDIAFLLCLKNQTGSFIILEPLPSACGPFPSPGFSTKSIAVIWRQTEKNLLQMAIAVCAMRDGPNLYRRTRRSSPKGSIRAGVVLRSVPVRVARLARLS